MKPPRVLVVVKGLGLGGAEMLIARTARYWDREAFEYEVVYMLPWKSQLVDDLERHGIRASCIGGRQGSPLSAALRLRSISRDFDLIHAHLPVTGILSRLATRLPVIYTEHNLISSYRMPTRLVNRFTYSRNAAVIAVSEPVAQALAGYPGPRPSVIRNGVAVEVDRDSALALRHDLAGDRPLIVHVGNIRPQKGHDNLIQAARIVRESNPGVQILSVGGEKNPGDLLRVREAAHRAGIGDTLSFLGRRSDAVELIAAADVYVSPADVEGLPLTVLEAMAVGTPVVATAVGGVPEIILDGETGLLTAPGDPESLARGIIELLSNRDLANRLARAAYELVTREHGVERMVRATERLYRSVLDAA